MLVEVNRSLCSVLLAFLGVVLMIPAEAFSQHSIARSWNEVLLESIRNDYARPTIHARNLFHTSIAMYDSWALFDQRADTYMLGKNVHGFQCDFGGIEAPADVNDARTVMMSYSAYRLMLHRFQFSPDAFESVTLMDSLMEDLGLDRSFTNTDYSDGSFAALGNALAQCLIDYGLQDGSNEENEYENLFYEPVNESLIPARPGNPELEDPNRWQPLTLRFVDQAGFVFPIDTPPFLSPEWGAVLPFALQDSSRSIYERDGYGYWSYHDPGPPPYLNTDTEEAYKWGFLLVALWSSHLDPNDGIMIDISPASIGNVPFYPESYDTYDTFYDLINGGDNSEGHTLNPITGEAYAPQMVPRGDYARVLAEFWADGPDSETPPGHWYTILNTVNDHPELVRKYRGRGEELDPLEWDVKAYFSLGGAMHDAAVTAWGLKGTYDYIRPISAIRYMASLGQSSDSLSASYHPDGLPLVDGYVELVEEGDALQGDSLQHVGKIKLYAWRGPDYIEEPETDMAGVGWILAENWWPYQRPTFITPPFAGFVSGHSTFSRAAAEVMTLLTGDPYFPGGIGEFVAPQNEFLVFEEGPSVDVVLQWATYKDASEQTSLSRIWGGIHPPADDIPGRLIGYRVGHDAFNLAETYFEGTPGELLTTDQPEAKKGFALYPTPVLKGEAVQVEIERYVGREEVLVYDALGRLVLRQIPDSPRLRMKTTAWAAGVYFVLLKRGEEVLESTSFVVR